MMNIRQYAWVLLFFVGLALGFYAYDNLIVIQALNPADPNRGWAWLTTDPEVIQYIKFLFVILGYWVLAVTIFVLVISLTGYRKGERGLGTAYFTCQFT